MIEECFATHRRAILKQLGQMVPIRSCLMAMLIKKEVWRWLGYLRALMITMIFF